jgi:hypothetical protein
MTVKELIERLKVMPSEMPVYIGDVSLGPLQVYDVLQEEIDESEWEKGEFLGYKKITVIVLWR